MIAAAIRKDMLLLVRDRGALASLFLLPLIFIAVFGSIFQNSEGGPGGIRIAVFNQSESSSGLISALENHEKVHLQIVDSVASAHSAVEAGDAAAALVLPEDFAPLLGHPGRLIIDGTSSPQERAAVQGAITGIVATHLMNQELAGPFFEIESAQKGEPTSELKSGFQVSVPGNAVLFGFFLALSVALSFLEDRRTGVLRRLLSSPASHATLVLAKLVPFFVIGLLQMFVLFGVGALVFGLELGDSLLGLFVLTLALVLCAVCLGLLIASFGGSEKQVGAIGSISLLVMGLLGGAMVPRIVMPQTMKNLGLATPQAWALDGYHEILVGGASSLVDVLLEASVLIAFALAFAVVGVLRFRFE